MTDINSMRHASMEEAHTIKYDEILTQVYGDYMTPRGQENANPNIWVKA